MKIKSIKLIIVWKNGATTGYKESNVGRVKKAKKIISDYLDNID